MSISFRLWIVGVLLSVIASNTGAFQDANGRPLKTRRERGIYRNEYGAVIKDSEGRRINYSREEIEAQASQMSAQSQELQARSLASALSPNYRPPYWSYAAFGASIGASNIIIGQNGAHTELYLSASSGGEIYWYALRYNPANKEYEQVYVSPGFLSNIQRIVVADIAGDSAKEIIIALGNGEIVLFDQSSKANLQTLTTLANGLSGLDVADLEGDGTRELILTTSNNLYVYSGTGGLKWKVDGVGGIDVVVAQMDDDSAPEIAVTAGHVVDSASHAVQWTWPDGFGWRLEAADIDGDNRKELIAAAQWNFVWSYDVERKLPKWSIPTPQDVGAIKVTDIDGDSVQELLVGDGQWGDITAFDTVTQAEEWFVDNPGHGVTSINTGDVDGDGTVELIWGANLTLDGGNRLHVVDWQTKQFEWMNIHLDGPFLGPEIGDLDGDGLDEIVTTSFKAGGGYDSGRIVVFDGATRRIRAISDPVVDNSAWTGLHDLKLRDVDKDGRLDILVAAGFLYDGAIEIYGFDAANKFTLKWANETRPSGATFNCVDAADIDNDGDIEIVGGVGREHTGAQGVFLYVYSYSTGKEEWHSLQMGDYWDRISRVELADLNQDGSKEIIGMLSGGNVYVFDGPTKLLEGIITGPFTDLRFHNMNGVPSIVTGNRDGELVMYRWSNDTYEESFRQDYLPTSIEGFTIDSQNRLWIGSAGTLYLMNFSSSILDTFSGFGSGFGLRVALLPSSALFFTTSRYSIVAYSACAAPSVDLTSDSHTSAGGQGRINVTASGAACYWQAITSASWISITAGGSGTSNGAVDYSVAPNTGGCSRVGTLTVAGHAITITQSSQIPDSDCDGIPDSVESEQGTNPNVKDNDLFNSNRLFVMQQYRDFLGREADPDGISYWTGVMSQGVSRAQVVDNFFNSSEFQGSIAPIARLYFAYFLRIPDYEGVLYWSGASRGGQPLATISENFAQSAEFQQRYGSLSNTEFVTLVYQNVLGRTPSQVEIDYWVGHLNSGALTRGRVMLGFSESDEYKAKIYNEVYVTMMYAGMLRRGLAQVELDYWVDLMDDGISGLQLIENFLPQAEYRNRFLPPL